MELAPDDLTTKERYALLTSCVVPRPIAWVTTVGEAGRTNLAPFSYFNGVGSDPVMITISIGDRAGQPKDTLRNIQASRQFCVHLVEEELAEAMNLSSGDFPPDVSEVEEAGLETVPCAVIEGVRLARARGALECKLVDVHRYGRERKVSLVVAEVVHAHLADEILHDGKPRVDADKIHPVARLGGPTYARLGERFKLARPKIE